MRSIHLLPRDEFGQTWTDDVNDDDGHNGCGALDDILRRSMIEMVVKPNSGGCVVLSGRLSEPYTGQSSAYGYPRQRRRNTTSSESTPSTCTTHPSSTPPGP